LESISSLKIENFRGLHDTPEIEFKKMNIIASPGNFGKTSFLQAVVTSMNYDEGTQILYTAHLFKKSKCRDYDVLRQLLYKGENFYTYRISAKFEDIRIKKSLEGVFLKNNQEFIGSYSAELESDCFNSVNRINNEISFKRQAEEGYIYRGLIMDDEIVGFTGSRKQGDRVFLSKLYLLEKYHGLGLGKILMDDCISLYPECSSVYLTVNKNNSSYNIYRHLGFEVIDSVVTDIGEGFVMDDYVMERRLMRK